MWGGLFRFLMKGKKKRGVAAVFRGKSVDAESLLGIYVEILRTAEVAVLRMTSVLDFLRGRGCVCEWARMLVRLRAGGYEYE